MLFCTDCHRNQFWAITEQILLLLYFQNKYVYFFKERKNFAKHFLMHMRAMILFLVYLKCIIAV